MQIKDKQLLIRVTEKQIARLKRLAGDEPLATWIRETMLRMPESSSDDALWNGKTQGNGHGIGPFLAMDTAAASRSAAVESLRLLGMSEYRSSRFSGSCVRCGSHWPVGERVAVYVRPENGRWVCFCRGCKEGVDVGAELAVLLDGR